MRKIILAAAAAGAALTLSACSEGTEDAADATVEEGMADAEANVEAMGEAADGAMEEAGAAMDDAAAAVDAAAASGAMP